MVIYFKEFDNRRDWRVLVEELAISATSVLTGDLVGLYKGVREAIETSEPDPGIDERAGIWLRVTSTAALLTLLDDPRFGGPLDRDPARKAEAKEFLAQALSLDGYERLEEATLNNPAAAPVLGQVVARLPEFVCNTTDGLAASATEVERCYSDLLRSTSARVHALDTAFYAPLEAALDSRFAAGYVRDLAWARHANWISGLYNREPIFSPDAPETLPLAAVESASRTRVPANVPVLRPARAV